MKTFNKRIASIVATALIAVTPFAAATEGQGLPIGAPDPVTNIVLGTFVGSTTERSVSWNAPASNGGSAITGYTATAMIGANFTQTTGATCSVPAGILTCSIIGMSFGTTYKIRVIANNSVGSSTPALSAEFTTPSVSQTVTITGAPTSVTFGAGATQLSATATSGLPVTWSSSTSGVCTVDNTGRVTYLTTGTCTIVATQDGSGSSYASASSTASISVGSNLSANATGASAITGTTATLGGSVPYPGSNTTVVFCISTTNSNANCATPSGVTIGTASPSTITASSGSNTSTTVSGLANATTYYYWVEATSGGSTEKSNTSSFTTLVAPTVGQTGPTSGQQNSLFSTTVSASGGSGVYLNWAVDTLPAGLALSPSGASATISGTPTAVGTTNSTVTVTDSNNLQASIQLTFTITAPPPPPPPPPSNDPVIDTTVDPTPTPNPSPSPSASPSPSPSASPSPSGSPSPNPSPSGNQGGSDNPGGNNSDENNSGGTNPGGEPIPDGRDPVTDSSGNLPKPNSGEGVLIEGGVTKKLVIEVLKDQRIQATIGEVVIQLSVRTADNQLRPIPITGDLTVIRGDSLAVSGQGFKPLSKLRFWLFSTPISLGELDVDANGKYSGNLIIPSTIDLRSHTLQINGLRNDSSAISVSFKINVVERENAPTPVSDSSTNPDTGTGGSANNPGVTKTTLRVLFFKSGSIAIDRVNNSRIKSFRSKRVSGTVLQCVGYTPKKSSNLKRSKALARAQATAACKQFIKVYKKSSKRVYTVSVKPISKAPKTRYQRTGKTQRVDLMVVKGAPSS